MYLHLNWGWLFLYLNTCEGKTYQVSMGLIMNTWAVGGLGWVAAGEFLGPANNLTRLQFLLAETSKLN